MFWSTLLFLLVQRGEASGDVSGGGLAVPPGAGPPPWRPLAGGADNRATVRQRSERALLQTSPPPPTPAGEPWANARAESQPTLKSSSLTAPNPHPRAAALNPDP
jgi:hypothetical protein